MLSNPEDSKEPTLEEQHLYWRFQTREIDALGWQQSMERIGQKVSSTDDPAELRDMLRSVLDHARREAKARKQETQRFLETHTDVAFRVFRPQDIRQAFYSEVEPLWPEEDDPGDR